MQIKVNGEPREFPGPLTVEGLAAALELNPRRMAVERNREIVPRATYAQVDLNEGDEIEIVHFIGGG
jgi:thiamine biosynthesis protein ThiS